MKDAIFIVHQSPPDARMDIYIDCVYQGVIPLKKTFNALADNEGNLLVEAVSLNDFTFHIKKYPTVFKTINYFYYLISQIIKLSAI